MSSCSQSGGCQKCKFSLFEELESIEEIEMTIDRVNHVGKLSRPFLEHWTIFNFRCPLFWRFLTCELLQGRWTDLDWFITNYSRSKSCPILSFEDFGMDNFMEDKEMTTIGSTMLINSQPFLKHWMISSFAWYSSDSQLISVYVRAQSPIHPTVSKVS